MNVSGSRLHVSPPQGLCLADCDFYHSMSIPGVGEIVGLWDLRETVDDHLGRIDFAGKRVLEIGPASGFLTIEMERRGADVVAVELPDGVGWDFVPFPEAFLARSGTSRSPACRVSRTASGSLMPQTNPRRR